MAARLGQVSDRGGAQNGPLDGERKPEMGSGVYPHSKELEQAHICLGMAGISQADPQRYPAYVLNTLLGGGMSSRLFQEIREKRGKAYSVYSFSSSYNDVGYLGVYAGTSVDATEEVVELILAELSKLAKNGITDDELRRTQGQLVGSMMLGLESTDSWMSHVARNEIYFGKMVPTDEICQRIRAVTRDDVVDFGKPPVSSRSDDIDVARRFQRRVQNQKPHGQPIALAGFLIINQSVSQWNRFAFRSSGCGQAILRSALPAYMTEGAAGMDLCADIAADMTLAPMARVLIPTGIAIALPMGFEAQIRPRSGLALKQGMTLVNSPGTIDADYRGEIQVIAINLGNEPDRH